MTDSLEAAKHSLVQKSGICLLTIDLPQLCVHQGLCVKCLLLTSSCSFIFLCSTHGVSFKIKNPRDNRLYTFSAAQLQKSYLLSNVVSMKNISIILQKSIQDKQNSKEKYQNYTVDKHSGQMEFQGRVSASHCRKAFRINVVLRKSISITPYKSIQNERDSCNLHGQDNLLQFTLAITVHILKHIKHLCHQNCNASFYYSNGFMCTTVL